MSQGFDVTHGRADTLEAMQERGEIDMGGKMLRDANGNGKLVGKGYGSGVENEIIEAYRNQGK